MQLLFFVKIPCEYDFFFSFHVCIISLMALKLVSGSGGNWKETRAVTEMDWELVTSLQNTTHPNVTPAPNF